MKNLFGAFIVTLLLGRLGMSMNVLEANVTGTTTFYQRQNTIALLKIERQRTTKVGTYGGISVDGNFVAYSMEESEKVIPEGLYDGYKFYSKKFHREVIYIPVAFRDGIEMHPANYPYQLRGCISPGLHVNTDSIDSSGAALDRILKLLPAHFKVLVYSQHA